MRAMIAVMKKGQVVEVGSHSELISKPGGAYATLGESVAVHAAAVPAFCKA